MILNIIYTQKRFVKVNGFYRLETYSKLRIDEETYRSITCKETMSFFRSLGGREIAIKLLTKFGNKIVALTSMSPDKDLKILRHFNFDEASEG